MALVEVNAVSKSYPRRAGLRMEEHMVVENVSFSIEAGETLGLVGESGSGKTTVARMILGLVDAQPRRRAGRRCGRGPRDALPTARPAPPDAAGFSGPLRRAQPAHEGAFHRYRAAGHPWA